MANDKYVNTGRVGWGGGVLGSKAAKKLQARERLIAKELEKRAGVV